MALPETKTPHYLTLVRPAELRLITASFLGDVSSNPKDLRTQLHQSERKVVGKLLSSEDSSSMINLEASRQSCKAIGAYRSRLTANYPFSKHLSLECLAFQTYVPSRTAVCRGGPENQSPLAFTGSLDHLSDIVERRISQTWMMHAPKSGKPRSAAITPSDKTRETLVKFIRALILDDNSP